VTIVEAPARSIRSPHAPAAPPPPKATRLVDHFELGLDAPICLTWELTYACNLSCVHCLSSSGRRDPRELSTEECKAVIDELERMQVFYVNIGGGEPTVRSDFWELVDYATAHHVGVKFSTNGVKITPEIAARLAANDYVDVQISLDGATAEVNDYIRGPRSYETAMRAMQHLSDAGMRNFKLSVVCTRQNIPQLDEFKEIADRYGAQLRLTRLRPSGRGADVWDELHPTREQQRELYDWLVAHGDDVLTGDSFFHLSAYGAALPGLNLCGAGRVVCLIDPIGDVYACPFAIHEEFLAGNIRGEGGFQSVWRESELFTRLRSPQSGGACSSCQFFDTCKGGCMAAKFFTGLPLDGPDPECVQGYGEQLLAERAEDRSTPKHLGDHSHRTSPPRPRAGGAPTGLGEVRRTGKPGKPEKVSLTLTRREDLQRPPVSACAEDPLAGFTAPEASTSPEASIIATSKTGADRRHQGGTRPETA
jgi:mycofactocin radical SAM maturase